MASTRRAPPLQIFQDPVSYDQNSPDHHVDQALYNALGPLSELSPNQNISLNPSYSASSVIPPPDHANMFTDSPQKKSLGPVKPARRALKPASEPFPMFTTAPHFDKENVFTPDMMSENSIYSKKGPLKRSFVDSAPVAALGDRAGNKKQKKPDLPSDLPVVLPDPDSMPSIEDDGNKPSLSYSQLIGMAILRSPNRRLTLAQIYKWISDSFKFYRSQETGWQNSIRHNLSLNKAFMKQERPKDVPGKGNYWAIQPGFEAQFLKEKKRTLSHYDQSFTYAMSDNGPSAAHSTISQPPVSNKVDSSKFPDEDELSSDATIPASDPAIHDGVSANASMMPPPARAMRSSPPPVDIRSSPPPIPLADDRDGTPPAVTGFVVSTTRSGGGRKRKLSALHSGLGDSGYYSSIESSAIRNSRALFPTSEADVEHHIVIKRGRAEEEIARIRSSSFDISPTKTRSNPAIIVSSSPYRGSTRTHHPPLTPGVIFKKPAMPPASISPNTNLRNHRNNVRRLLGSPDKSLGVLENSPLPMLGLPEYDVFGVPGGDFLQYDVFQDTESPIRPRTAVSPDKRSAKRPRLERANTTASILADITGVNTNARLGSQNLSSLLSEAKGLRSPLRLGSPVKRSNARKSSLLEAPKLQLSHFDAINEVDENADEDYLFAVNLPSDESEPGVDLSQGFQRIGAGQPPSHQGVEHARHAPTTMDGFYGYVASPSKPQRSAPGRPTLGRSSSTRF